MIAFVLIMFMADGAQASDIYLFCEDGQSPTSCRYKTELALGNLKCDLITSETACQYALLPDPRQPENPDARIESDSVYCKLRSSNCSAPQVGLFGGENCFDKEKVTIPREYGVHHNYWFGLFGSYSRTICRVR